VTPAGARARAASPSLDPFDANWEYTLERAIFTSAMNPGLGGGPLIDRRGRVAGVVSLNLNEIGRFSLAIPIAHYRDHRDELLRYGRRTTRPSRAWLGLYCYLLRGHVVVAGLLPGGPAEAAGSRRATSCSPSATPRCGRAASSTSACGTPRRGRGPVADLPRRGVRTITVASANVEEFFR
jgi:S1-C subfamily serine protease